MDVSAEGSEIAAALEAGGKLIREFEKKFDVNALRFRGIRVWPRIRSMMIFAYSSGLFQGDDKPMKRYGTLSNIMQLSRIPPKLEADVAARSEAFSRAANQYQGRPLAFLGRQPRQLHVDGKPWNILFDPLINLMPSDSPKLVNLLMQPPNKKPTKTDTIFAELDNIVDWLALLEPVHDLFVQPPQHPREVEGIDEFIKALPHQLAANISVSSIIKDLAFIQRMSIIFRIYLEKAKPPVIFLSGHRRVNMAMILAARQLGIRTVDIQHGASVFSPTGYKWHSWRHIPDEGYELLPDYFWVWGQQAADNINSLGNPKCPYHKTLVGGHPALLSPVEYELPERFKSSLKDADMRVLVTMGHLEWQGLPENLVDAMKRSPKSWKWILRLHPKDFKSKDSQIELRSRLNDARIENAEFEIGSSAPLTSLLAEVDWHITPYSSTAYEASAFGVPTIYVHPFAHSNYGYLLNKPGFFYEVTTEGILSLLSQKQRAESLVQNDPEVARGILKDLLSTPENEGLQSET